MTRAEKGKEYFSKGYNCAQAVVLSFSDLTGADETLLENIALPFGGGLGRMRTVCGAISGAAMVIGLLYGNKEGGKQNKDDVYSVVQEVLNAFKERNNSIICMELLKGVSTSTSPISDERTPAYYKKRPCGDLVSDAIEILEKYIEEHGVYSI